MIPEDLKAPDEHRRCRVNGRGVEAIGETAYQQSDSLPAARGPNQNRVTLVNLLWAEGF